MNENTLSKIYVPLLILAALLPYAATLQHGFVWDDTIYTIGNHAYQHFDLRKIFFSLANGVEYLPLRDLTYALDYAVWGERPLGFHLTNLILFLLNILLIYHFTAELPFAGDTARVRKRAAFLTTLLCAVHPLQSEAVNFITCRNVLLAATFFFGAALSFARFLNTDSKPVSWRLPIILSACFLAALFAKATSIVLPAVLLLLALTIPTRRTVRQLAVTLAPLWVMAVLFFGLYREIATHSRIIDTQAVVPFAEKLATALQIPFFYLGKLLVPLGFSAEYAADGFSPILASSPVLAAVIGLLGLTVGTIILRRRYPVIGFALLWYGITLLPVLNFFVTNPIVADRYAYLPTYAAAVLAGFLLSRLGDTYPRGLAAAVTALALTLAGIAAARSLDWRSDVTLWQANIRTEPTNAKGYQNLIAEAIITNDLSLAQTLLTAGRAKAPSPSYDYLEGKMYYLSHDLTRALAAFESAVQQDPNHLRSLLNIGMIYQEMGTYDKAADYYRRTLAANAPDGWGCREQARQQLRAIGQEPDSRR